MVFKQFTIYKVSREMIVGDLSDLNAALEIHKERPIGALEQAVSGFTAPLPTYSKAYVQLIGHIDAQWRTDAFEDDQPFREGEFSMTHFSQDMSAGALVLSYFREEKVIVSSDLKRRIARRVAEIEQNELRKVYKRERAEIREDILAEIMPYAQTRYYTVPIVFLPSGYLLVGATGAKAEHALNELRMITGTLPVRPVGVKTHIPVWLTVLAVAQRTGESGPFRITSDFQMQDWANEDPAIARCKNTDITDENIAAFLEDGKGVTHAQLLWHDKISFRINPKLQIQGLRVDDAAFSEYEAEDDTNLYAYTTALIELQLIGTMLSELLSTLEEVKEVFDGEREPKEGPIYLHHLARSARNSTPVPESDDDHERSANE